MPAIVVLNIFAFDIALLVTVSAFWQRPTHRYIIAFAAILLTGILADSIRNYLLPVYVVLLMICFAHKHLVFDTIVAALTAAASIWGMTMLAGCLVLLLAPTFLTSIQFNIFNGLLIVGFGLSLKCAATKRRTTFLPEHRQGKVFLVALELLILLFFAFVLPRFALQNMQHYAIAQLTLMALLVVVCVLLAAYNKSHEKNRILSQERRQAEIIEQEYNAIIGLKHYYSKLYESIQGFIRRRDLAGLESYFDAYITPIHRKNISLQNVDNIKTILIANLLELAANYASSHPIVFHYEIAGQIDIPKPLEMDVFHILAEWLNNAIESLENQKDGKLTILMTGIPTQCSFIISNSCAQLQNTKKRGRGHGLPDIYRIIDRNPHFERVTETRDARFSQHLMVHF